MANISAELAAIMNAVFGRDVRQSIHDAIYKVNDVSEKQLGAGTAVTSSSSSSANFTDGSFYINTNTYELWLCTGVNTWQSLGILKGTDGNSITSITGPTTVGLVDTYVIHYSNGGSFSFNVTNGQNGQNGSKWYKSTAINGTGSGMTGYPGNVDDFLLNPTTGNVYRCYQAGTATTAQWEFVMVLGGGSSSVAVIDHLNSTSSTDALSANQGRVLNNPTITQAGSRTNIATGDTLPTIFGKIKKWFADLGDLAFINKDGNSSTKFLRGDGQWANVVVDTFTAAQTISSDTFTFTGLDDTHGWGYTPYFSVDGNSTNMNPTAQITQITGAGTASMSITYQTDADVGSSVKLRIDK